MHNLLGHLSPENNIPKLRRDSKSFFFATKIWVNKAFERIGASPTNNKVLITLYIESWVIEKSGGKDKMKEMLYKYISDYTGTEDGI